MDENFAIGEMPIFAPFATSLAGIMTSGKVDMTKIYDMSETPSFDKAGMLADIVVSSTKPIVNGLAGTWPISKHASNNAPATGLWFNGTVTGFAALNGNDAFLKSALDDDKISGHTTIFSAQPGGSGQYAKWELMPGRGTLTAAPVTDSAIPSVLGLSDMGLYQNPDTLEWVVGIRSWPGFEALCDYYASEYGCVHLGNNSGSCNNHYRSVTGTVTARIAGYSELVSTLGAKSADALDQLWGVGLAAVGRPFGSYAGMLFANASGATVDSATINRIVTLASSDYFFRVTFAQLATAIDLAALKITGVEEAANLATAAAKLRLHPDYTLGAVERSDWMPIVADALASTHLWTSLGEAGVDMGTEVVGTQTINAIVTKLNGLVHDSSFSLVTPALAATPYTDDLLNALNNAVDYRVEVSTVSGSFEFALGTTLSGTIDPQPVWFDETVARVLLDSGSSIVTFDSSDLVGAESYLASLIGEGISNKDSRLAFNVTDYNGAGYPLVAAGISNDYEARLIFHSKGLETQAIKEQLRLMIGALRT
jgi:hypothetical protein